MKKLIFYLLCTMIILPGCAKTEAATSSTSDSYVVEEKEEVIYTSKIKKEECALCSKAGNTLLPIYDGQNNLGIICINTFDMSPVSINRYDDYGKLIEEPAGSMSMTHNSFGEGGMFTGVSAFSERGYANVDVSFSKDKAIEKNSVEKLLCQDCLSAVMEETWNTPYGVGLINFETLEIRLFEESITGFSFGDYYIDIDRQGDEENEEQIDLDLLIFYCPPRYE